MKGALVFTPSLSMAEMFGWIKGLRTGEVELDAMLMTMEDLRKAHTVFSVPIFFIQGEDDNITPTSVVADYVSKIQAPVKKLDIVPGAGHWVMWTHPTQSSNPCAKTCALPPNSPHRNRNNVFPCLPGHPSR